MACRRKVQKSGRNDSRQPYGAVDGPAIFRFFKVVLSTTLEQKKLRIPNKFVRIFGDELTDVANLTAPDGRVWKVGLSKEGNGVWFDDGWQKFTEHHSIRHGHFLVFGYKGFCSFSVILFDATACEIDFKDINTRNNEREVEKLVEITDIDDHEKLRKERVSELDEPLATGIKLVDEFEMITCENFNSVENTPESERAIAAARMNRPENPSFMVVLHQSSFRIARQYIPSKFSKYLSGDSRRVKLRVSEGKEWEVSLSTRGFNRWDIGRGWNKFRRGNNLKEGDVCVFELLKDREALKVSIFRAFEDARVQSRLSRISNF